MLFRSGVCDFAARPQLSAGEQPIFWSESANTSVLRLVTGIPPPGEEAVPLRVFLDGDVMTTPETLHILLQDKQLGLHVVAPAGSNPDTPLAALVHLGRNGLDRIAALDRLLRYLHGYKVPPDQRMTAQQRRRLKAMLRAADAREHNASQREIARVLFGVERIASEHWKTSPLRDTVSDLLKDGAVMIAGGYRKLLRFRRRL